MARVRPEALLNRIEGEREFCVVDKRPRKPALAARDRDGIFWQG